MDLAIVVAFVEKMIDNWQCQLGPVVKVVLGGSLVSGLFVFDEMTEVIDVDIRFLTEDPLSDILRSQIEKVTRLVYRKTIMVNDWPEGISEGVILEGRINIPTIPIPIEIEGCIRNPKYIGWAQFFQKVLSQEELDEFVRKKKAMRIDKKEYKALKERMRQLVASRCIEQGLVSMKGARDE
jgi:hypothetical protein